MKYKTIGPEFFTRMLRRDSSWVRIDKINYLINEGWTDKEITKKVKETIKADKTLTLWSTKLLRVMSPKRLQKK